MTIQAFKRRWPGFLIFLLLIALPGCGDQEPVVQADMALPSVICFSPALTRLMIELHLENHIAGVSSFCQLPPGMDRPVVGNALNVRAEPILAVGPDMIFAQNHPADFAAVTAMDPSITLEHFQIETLDEIAAAMERIGTLCGDAHAGRQAGRAFQSRLRSVENQVRSDHGTRPAVVFVMGQSTPAAAGSGTFLDQMITLAGGHNPLAQQLVHWKSISAEQVLAAAPALLICQVEPAGADTAADYWRRLLDSVGLNDSVVWTVTEPDWTIPAGHLADYTERLAARIAALEPERKDQP